MKGRSRLAWVIVALAFAAFVFSSLQSTKSRGVDIGDPVDGAGLMTLDGAPVDLEAWRGRGLVLRLSATTCTACPRDFAALDALGRQLGDEVQVVAVQVGEAAATVRTGLMGESFETPIWLDPSGRFAERLGVKSLPALFFVTKAGTLSSVSHTELARTDVEAHVRALLAGGPHLERDVRYVAERLQCLECEGRSAWESDSASSIAMRERVREMLQGGMRRGEVLDAFAAEYGEWILMAPRARGVGALVWWIPLTAAVMGGAFWVVLLRRARRSHPGPSRSGDEDRDFEEARARLARRIDEYL